MCGLAGVYGKNGLGEGLGRALKAAADQLIHRGPDEEGFYTSSQVVLAHRRLSILDLQHGQQPMQNDSSDIVLVFNGEIFNFVELRNTLSREGVIFRTKSDTEVILRLYEKKGLDFVRELNGQFAIVIWDARQQKLIMVRDRVGICPLFYSWQQDQLVFASEIKAMKPLLKEPLTLDRNSLNQIFTYWAPLSPKTVFENVFEVRPGQMIVIDREQQRETFYWDWQFPEPSDFDRRPFPELCAELKDLLLDATRIRLRADVPVGGYLSGGIDSSILLSLIQPLQPNMASFSINFSDQEFDESHYQNQVIDQLGTRHHSITCNAEMIGKALLDTIWHTETPVLRSAPVPMGMLSGLAREAGFKVVLTGEGADEVFCGYDIFREAKVRHFWAQYPDSNFRASLLKRLYPYLQLPSSGAASYLKSFFGDGLDQPDSPWFSHSPRWSTTGKAKKFFTASMPPDLDIAAEMQAWLPPELGSRHLMNRAQFIEARTLMSGYLLNSQGDRMLMKNSVEGRFPFLDHRVIEFANRIPPKHKLRVLREKHILKETFANQIPPEILHRYKQPYRTPDVSQATQLLTSDIRDLTSKAALNRVDIFNANKVQFLLKKVDSGKRITNTEAQTLLGIISTQAIHHLFVGQ